MRKLLRQCRWDSITGWVVALGFLPTVVAHATEPKDVEKQVREFKISVDGKPCGMSTVRIFRRDDDTERIQGQTQVRVKILAHPYTYSSAGSEVWKDGRLIAKETTSNYNGKRYVVQATGGPNGMQVTANGDKSKADANLWVTSYWQLPKRLEISSSPVRTVDASGKPGQEAETRPVALLDSDQGRLLQGELECVGVETIAAAGREVECTHYRITGDVQVNVWYDSSRRLVRQESMEWLHKTVLELAKITEE